MKIPDNDGGPAFPQAKKEMCIKGQTIKQTQGMTLRDYFAASALTNLRINEPAYDWKIIAETAYKYADAMIEARNK